MNNLYNMKNLTIEPLKGFGDIKFGMSIEDIIGIYGEPSNNEELEPIIEEYENYSKDKKKAEFEKARKEAEAVKNARQRNQDDYYVALYMCAELRDARR